MDITIKRLTPDMADDYFDFFDNRAFTDDSPYRCYCQMYQMSKARFERTFGDAAGNKSGNAAGDAAGNESGDAAAGEDMGALAKREARRQLEAGELRGYLAYADGKAIGWCNANDRASFPSEPCVDVLFYAPEPHREIAVTCFEIAPECRGMGVATALLKRVIADAGADGYASVVAFPVRRDERFEWDCTGPVRLFEKAGFSKQSERGETIIMIKDIAN